MTSANRKIFLEGIATERLKKLIDIALEKSRPWTDFYAPPQSSENWFENYG